MGCVVHGRQYFSQSVRGAIIDRLLEREDASTIRSTRVTLNRWERQFLGLVTGGHKNRKFADFLGITVKTVEKHRGTQVDGRKRRLQSFHYDAELNAALPGVENL
jgi:FixJ family two-component response regulator